MNGLVVFIDSLRFDAAADLALEEYGLTPRRYVPPLGYSANILPLLYRGRTPDELGFYNEYGVGEKDRLAMLSRLDPLVEGAGRIPILRKVIYRALRGAGVDAANIPMRHLPYFTKHSISAYTKNARHPSILESAGFHLVVADRIRKQPPERDRRALHEARGAIERHPRVFLSLCDLDSVSHEWGLDSPEYQQHRDTLREEVRDLLQRFRRLRGESAPVVVLSDHGMAPVVRAVRPSVEERLGRPGRGTYLYFVDSTMVRIWCFDDAIRPRIAGLLHDWRELGRVVSDEERRKWGLADPGNGDYIFVLDEGLVFEPNFIGRGVPKAMHGYHPHAESQHAVFFTSHLEKDGPTVLEGSQPYEALRTLFVQ